MSTQVARRPILALLVIIVMVVPSMTAASMDIKVASNPEVQNGAEIPINEVLVLERRFEYGAPEIVSNDRIGTYDIRMDGMPDLMEVSMPSLPMEAITIALPPDMMVVSVGVETAEAVTIALDRMVTPTPRPMSNDCSAGPDGVPDIEAYEMAPVYAVDGQYPPSKMEFSTSFGLTTGVKDRDHIVLSKEVRSQYVDIKVFPVGYNPVRGLLQYHPTIDLEVRYAKNPDYVGPTSSRAGPYDMVIITPQAQASAYQVLADHHNDTGITTTVVALEDIYNGVHFAVQGSTDPERIKYFIKDAIENWSIEYVILGADHPLIPRVYAWVIWEFGSDLFYGDIYMANGTYASWNDDGDANLGEFTDDMGRIDIRPDVYFGRLPSANAAEASIMVEKVRYHDNNTAGADWFKTVTHMSNLAGGSEYGDYLNDNVYTEDKGWTHNNLYGQKSTVDNFTQPQNHSVGVLTFWGHGGETKWLGATNITVDDVMALDNFQRLPIVTIMACECGSFDFGSDCFAEAFLKAPNGGGLTAFAGTQTSNAEDHDTWAGATNKYFHEAYKDHDLARVGQMYVDGVNLFVENKNPRGNSLNYKNLVQYIFFGDPAATIGGYSVTTGAMSVEDQALSAYPGENVTFNITVDNTGSGFAEVFARPHLPDGSEVPARWSVEMPSYLRLQGGEDQTFGLNVTIPADADANEALDMVVNLTSVHITGAPLTAQVTATARTVYSMDLNITSNTTEVAPEVEVTYTMTVTNMGNDEFWFDLEPIEALEDWEVALSDTTVVLARDQSTDIDLTLRPGPNVTAGSYHMGVRCTLSNATGMSSDIWVNTTVMEVHGFTMTAIETVKDVDQGQKASFNLTLQNLGNHPDVVDITFPNEGTLPGWGLSVAQGATLPLGPFATLPPVTIEAGVPSTALAGNYTIKVEAMLASDGTKQDIELVATVLPLYSFELTTEEGLVEGKADTTVMFELKVTNNGNSAETYDLALEGLPEDWEYEMADLIVVEPYYYLTTVLEVTIDDGDIIGGLYQMTASATARGENRTLTLVLGVDIPKVLGMDAGINATKAELDQGDAARFELTVKNTGNSVDTYKVTVTQVQGWTTVIDRPEVLVGAFDTDEVLIDITSPGNAIAGDAKFRIDVVSKADPSVKWTEDVTVSVRQVFALDIRSWTAGGALDIGPGGIAQVGYGIRNLGNGKDRVTVTIEVPPGWNGLSPQTLDLDANETDGGQFDVVAPQGARDGKYDIRVVAVSAGDPTVTDELELTITVKGTDGTDTGLGLSTGLIAAIIAIIAVVILVIVMVIMKGRTKDPPTGDDATPSETEPLGPTEAGPGKDMEDGPIDVKPQDDAAAPAPTVGEKGPPAEDGSTIEDGPAPKDGATVDNGPAAEDGPTSEGDGPMGPGDPPRQ